MQFRVLDVPGQRLGKAHRADEIETAEGDQRGGRDPGQLRCGVMTEDGLRLTQEGLDRLRRSAAHEVRQ
jgi:hypothetical protein